MGALGALMLMGVARKVHARKNWPIRALVCPTITNVNITLARPGRMGATSHWSSSLVITHPNKVAEWLVLGILNPMDQHGPIAPFQEPPVN